MEKKIAKAMRRLREEVFGGLSMTKFGKAGGVSASTVSRWEAGLVMPDLSALWRLRKFARRHKLAWRDDLIFGE